jgi:hypothetical protein
MRFLTVSSMNSIEEAEYRRIAVALCDDLPDIFKRPKVDD